jgi:AcrR family transcriptional regulator
MEKVNKQLTHRQKQALATRKLIVDTATALFLENGYVATTIDTIAAQAGVAVSTVYAIFTNKRGILREIRQEWHAESRARERYAQASQEEDASRFLELIASGARRQWQASRTMMAIYSSAAAADPEAAAELDAAQNGRRTNLGMYVRDMRASLRADLSPAQATAILLALTRPEVYQELVEYAGWSPDDYEAWIADALKQQLLPRADADQ